jgi:hypothetical protein
MPPANPNINVDVEVILFLNLEPKKNVEVSVSKCFITNVKTKNTLCSRYDWNSHGLSFKEKLFRELQ